MSQTLTEEELKWLKKLQKVLDQCPSSRLGFYTIGDHDVNVYDKRFDKKIDELMKDDDRLDFCTAVSDADASFEVCVNFPSHVHSTAG